MYRIMKWSAIAIVAIISTIVALAFAISLVCFLNRDLTNKDFPQNMADLQIISVTVKSALITRSPQYISPVEYPTEFTIPGQLPEETILNQPVNPGDHVDIYIAKKDLQALENKSPTPSHMQAYGITTQNGVLVNANQFLDGKIEKRINRSYISIMIGCFVYFAAIVCFLLVRKKTTWVKQNAGLPPWDRPKK